MGQYWHGACHTCRLIHVPELLKLGEIEGNLEIAAGVGRFFARHAGHKVEMVMDDDGGWDRCAKYEDERAAHPEVAVPSADLQHRKGRIIAADTHSDEITLRLDVGAVGGVRVGSIVAITPPVA